MVTDLKSILTGNKENSFLKDLLLVIGAAFALSLTAPLTIALPFSPVPIVAQNSLVLLTGVLLGSKRGSLAVMLFLFEAACGLPVLSFCRGGLAHFVSPTGGYLVGYIAGAYLAGFIAERVKKQTLFSTIVAMSAGNGATYLFGSVWLSTLIGAKQALVAGVLPFIFVDFAKLTLLSLGLFTFRRK